MTRPKHLFPALLLGLSATAHADIRVYDVDEPYRQEVFEALQSILGSRGPLVATGKAAMLPNGQILVDSSEERHAEIQAVLEAIERNEPADTPSISLRYWVLFGTPAAPDGADRLPPLLTDVASEIEAAHGDLDFDVLDSATLVGSRGSSQSETLEVAQRVELAGSRINANIDIQTAYQELSVTTTLTQGEFLVLGESPHEDDAGTRGILAFVLHWPARAD